MKAADNRSRNQEWAVDESGEKPQQESGAGFNNENELRSAIATWAVSHNITHNACNHLLQIFCRYTSYNIPTDVQTLL